MRHRVYGRHLGRDKDERSTLFKGLLSSLFTYGTIQTSESKAKAIKGLVDRVINLAKDKKGQKRLQSFITDKNLTDRLIKEVIPKLGSRNSGYTSLVKLGQRFGDNTLMVRMSLIGAEELKPMGQVIGTRQQVTVNKKGSLKRATSVKKLATKKPVARKRVTKKK